jgi:hypothetical protein
MSEKERNKAGSDTAEAASRNPHYPWLTAVPSISLLGDHDGILDDDMFELLNAEVERKSSKDPS